MRGNYNYLFLILHKMDYKILTYKETIERLKLWETDKNTNKEAWLYKI
jgi:hypothetical protein